MAIPVVFKIIVVVLLVVGNHVAQSETIVSGDEVDTHIRSATIVLIEIAAAGEPVADDQFLRPVRRPVFVFGQQFAVQVLTPLLFGAVPGVKAVVPLPVLDRGRPGIIQGHQDQRVGPGHRFVAQAPDVRIVLVDVKGIGLPHPVGERAAGRIKVTLGRVENAGIAVGPGETGRPADNAGFVFEEGQRFALAAEPVWINQLPAGSVGAALETGVQQDLRRLGGRRPQEGGQQQKEAEAGQPENPFLPDLAILHHSIPPVNRLTADQ
ncbi:MAG: hypothetical protein BWY73_00642 [candidate division TA06 bacterium ADurb.Bin417]|uniref:Uncharacterized protein n=1 Tax=candidate division TA06 bacterium ADurb.Bin417 TaxID=1852828 RepID=A0A1V5MIM6_UNCT6|nr:MAG: hypothetical protein BWY73_00642 [candidate division TA06 bacterium ADurb.Bin417]